MLWQTVVLILILAIILFGLLFKRQRLLNDIKHEILEVNEESGILFIKCRANLFMHPNFHTDKIEFHMSKV